MLEAGRGLGLSRQAATNGIDFTSDLSPGDAQQLRAAGHDLAAADHLFNSARDKLYRAPAGSLKLEELQKQKQVAQARLEVEQKSFAELRDKLLAKYPQYRGLAGAAVPTTAQFKDLASRHSDTIYIEIAPVDNKSTLVATLSQAHGIKFKTLNIGEKELRLKAAAWRTAISLHEATGKFGPASAAASSTNPGNAKSENEQAAALYAELIAPLEKAGLLPQAILPHPTLSQGEREMREAPHRLCVVASGPLLDLPFAALLDSHGRRLAERYTVSSAIALGIFFWPQNSHHPGSSLLCAADPMGSNPERIEGPDTSGSSPKVAVRGEDQEFRSEWRGNYAALPGARVEGRAVAALFSGSQFVAGSEAKKSVLVTQLPKYEILHFATHGHLDARDGMRSGLILAHEKGGSEQQTVITAKEIASLPLSAELAVLSACHTGQGQPSGGEGALGFAWAFRAAGVPSLVASLWSVEDEATKEWMLTFYKALKEGKRKDDAVQAAMLAVMKSHPSPYYWAAFELIGDASPISLR
jgi:CHAT domain-containing protein